MVIHIAYIGRLQKIEKIRRSESFYNISSKVVTYIATSPPFFFSRLQFINGFVFCTHMRRTYYRFRVSTPQDSVDMMTCHVKTNYKKPLRENICSSSHAPDKRLITPLQICDIIILYRACVSAYKVCVLLLLFWHSCIAREINALTLARVLATGRKNYSHTCASFTVWVQPTK